MSLPPAQPAEAPEQQHPETATANVITRRAALRAGWVAPVVLAIPLSGFCFDNQVSASACEDLKDNIHDDFEDAFKDFDWDNPDWSTVDWSKIDWTQVKQYIDCSEIDWNKIDWGKIDCSKIDWSKFCQIDWRTIDCSRIQFNKLNVNWWKVDWTHFSWERCRPVPTNVKWSWVTKSWFHS